MIANNKIDPRLLRAGHFRNGLYSAVQRDHNLHPVPYSMVDAPVAYAIAFCLPVGKIVRHIWGELSQKAIDHSHRTGAVHIVIAVNQYFFTLFNSQANTPNSFFHILHQKWIEKILQVGIEEFLYSLVAAVPTVQEQFCQKGVQILNCRLQIFHTGRITSR